MRPEPKRLESEIISPTMVMVAVRPDDGHGSAVMVSHKEALRFAKGLLAQLEPPAFPAISTPKEAASETGRGA